MSENAPEFHDRRSLHTDAVARDRELLMDMAGRSLIPGAEAEVEALTDWEVVQKVEELVRGARQLHSALQGLGRSLNAAVARFAEFGATLEEALAPAMAEQLATESELFLRIDHSG